jgi:predicted RNA-binding Zn-ribbon protein involved in translation (DUF1610 family)
MATLANLLPRCRIFVSGDPQNPKAVICDQEEPPRGSLQVMDAGEEDGRTLFLLYRNARKLRCPYCGTARFRLCSAGRQQPYFACDGCGQMLEM